MSDDSRGPSPGLPCGQEEYFCKYDKQAGVWYLIQAVTKSGYYCISQNFGDAIPYQCSPPLPGSPSRMQAAPVPDTSDRLFCHYELFPDGEFHIVAANCESGSHCPATLSTYLKEQGSGELKKKLESLTEEMKKPDAGDPFVSGIVVQPLPIK